MILHRVSRLPRKAINRMMATITRLDKSKVEIIISKLFLFFSTRIIKKSLLLLSIVITIAF